LIPIVFTGDTHREYGRLLEIYNVMKKYKEEKEKYICVLGDFGYLFDDSFSEKKLLDDIEKQDFVFIVIPGNHENYKAFREYEIVDFHGAKAHKVRENIYYICRGEIFELAGKFFYCMGGGNSVDRYMRRKDISYWEEEMPTDGEYKYAADTLDSHRKKGKKIDYILSHTAPLSGLAYLGKNHGQEEWPLNNFLEYVRETVKDEYTMHFYGHLHVDKELPSIKQRALWFDYVEILLEEDMKMHQMKLYNDPFCRIKSGEKTIELRLYDEKRRDVNVGDEITFTNIDTGEQVITKCNALYTADSFVELFSVLKNTEKMGVKHNESPEDMSEQMREYYSIENEEKYGVVGIEIEVLAEE